jgi:hypothetical protein
MTLIRVVRHRRQHIEFWIPESAQGAVVQLVREPGLTDLEYWIILAAHQRAFGGLFTIIGE